MKAVRFHKTGGPEVLVYEDVPDPKPRDGEVVIKVEAAGLNFSDEMRRSGDDYPEPSTGTASVGFAANCCACPTKTWWRVARRPFNRKDSICTLHTR